MKTEVEAKEGGQREVSRGLPHSIQFNSILANPELEWLDIVFYFILFFSGYQSACIVKESR